MYVDIIVCVSTCVPMYVGIIVCRCVFTVCMSVCTLCVCIYEVWAFILFVNAYKTMLLSNHTHGDMPVCTFFTSVLVCVCLYVCASLCVCVFMCVCYIWMNL